MRYLILGLISAFILNVAFGALISLAPAEPFGPRIIELSLEDAPSTTVCVHHGDIGRHCFDLDKLALEANARINDGALVSELSSKFDLNKPYSNDSIHIWACDTVIKFDESHSKSGGGCYDICDGLSMHVKTDGWIYDKAQRSGRFKAGAEPGEPFPIALSIEAGYSDELINACAITLNGAEW